MPAGLLLDCLSSLQYLLCCVHTNSMVITTLQAVITGKVKI
ncbi:hypothetical protein ASZ90_005955 [hydrocarbon metagenome]|uniref:Uncharacterized protein n=1 Tax=hydrocarbon metagenome TaxID=938273 RepID=A0A0W8FTN6_9ZZZZ